MEDCIIVESDGTKPIYVKRTDIDLDSKQGREMALADNATGKAARIYIKLHFDYIESFRVQMDSKEKVIWKN
jgi:hypothetical protein